MEKKYRIAHSRHRKRIAAPILQWEYGCDDSIAHRFPESVWLLSMAEDVIVEDFTEKELSDLIEELGGAPIEDKTKPPTE